MSSLSTLYQYEMKKIMRRKIFWITLAVCMLCIVFTVTAGLIGSQDVKRDGEVVDSVSYYEMFLTDRRMRGVCRDDRLTRNCWKKPWLPIKRYRILWNSIRVWRNITGMRVLIVRFLM